MKKVGYFLVSFIALTTLYSNCSQHGFETINNLNSSSLAPPTSSIAPPPPGTSTPVTSSDTNVMKITMGCGYVNEPCVNVTICAVGTNTCQTISNILLDTGSYGLRVFSSAISIGLNPLVDTSNRTLAECQTYMDGTSQWGPVKVVDIMLGQERASHVPMQVIDSTFGTPPSDCTNLDSAGAGYSGILGVGQFTDDCGSACVNSVSNGIYYACSGITCAGTSIGLAYQVSNPVSFLPVNNNGVILQLPIVADSGALSADGSLIMGIGTRANNTAAVGVNFFQADSAGNFKTSFNGSTVNAFIDSGSNGLFLPATSTLPSCTASYANGFFCPSSQLGFVATQIASGSGTNQKSISFNLANAEAILVSTNANMVFNNLGGALSSDFDWGLPFFLGRSVFVGIDGKTSSMGTGPYWAY